RSNRDRAYGEGRHARRRGAGRGGRGGTRPRGEVPRPPDRRRRATRPPGRSEETRPPVDRAEEPQEGVHHDGGGGRGLRGRVRGVRRKAAGPYAVLEIREGTGRARPRRHETQ